MEAAWLPSPHFRKISMASGPVHPNHEIGFGKIDIFTFIERPTCPGKWAEKELYTSWLALWQCGVTIGSARHFPQAPSSQAQENHCSQEEES